MNPKKNFRFEPFLNPVALRHHTAQSAVFEVQIGREVDPSETRSWPTFGRAWVNPLVRYKEAEKRGVTPSLFDSVSSPLTWRFSTLFQVPVALRHHVFEVQIGREVDSSETRSWPTFGWAWVKERLTIVGINERRYISKIRVDSAILKTIFDSVCPRISFNLMMITNDHKIFLLQRSQSFHYPKVIRDLKLNKINLNLLKSLYTSEMETVRHLFFDFLPPPKQEEHLKEDVVYIFPGGHSNRGEPVLLTLIREFQEETSLKIDIQNLKFHQSCIFNVLIYDLMIRKWFNNYVFPAKIDLSSKEISDRFVPTKHTKNPTFVDISGCETLSDIFVRVQNFMLL